MNKFLIVLLTVFSVSLNAQSISKDMAKAKAKAERKVKKIMSKMDLADKVGEMTQLTIDVLSFGEPYNLDKPHKLSPEKLEDILVKKRVGSILNAGGYAYTREHWNEIHKTIYEYTQKKKSKIPVLYGIDAIHGTNYTVGSTLFPQQIAQAASWDPAIAEQIGTITAYETRASGIPFNFSPVLDIARNPLWPRVWETFGEDPLLASTMGKAILEGYQGEDISNPEKVAACGKHFLGYGIPVSGKDRTPAWVPPHIMHEYVVPPFKAAMENGLATIMINSGEVNGVPVHASKDILTHLLRDELGFEGIALTDWEDIIYLYTRHRVAKDHKDAIRIAINAGVDMSMVSLDSNFPILLKELVEEGEVPMERIDEAVHRILMLKMRLGLFDTPYTNPEDYPNFASEESRQISLAAAEGSITLLKNEKDILPLKEGTSIFLTGPNAEHLRVLNGGWTGTWQGRETAHDTPGKKSIAEYFQAEMGAKVNYQKTVDDAKSISEDVIVVCLGEDTYTEIPGNIEDMHLPKEQAELVEKLAESGKPIVLVLVEGRPRIIREIEPNCGGIIQCYLPGNEGAEALSNVLFGKVNPSGKLPYTYPRYPNSLLTYDYKGTDRMDVNFGTDAVNPQFEFGYGLSYTTFEYSDLKIADHSAGMKGNIEISVSVSNSGAVTGKEVVQLYVTDLVATITPSIKRLRAFEKIELQPGETKKVSFTIDANDLGFANQQGKWTAETGEFIFRIADLKEQLELK